MPSGVAINGHILAPGGYPYTIFIGAFVLLDASGWLHGGSTSIFVSSATATNPAAETGLTGLIMNGFGVRNITTGSGARGSVYNDSSAAVAYTGRKRAWRRLLLGSSRVTLLRSKDDTLEAFTYYPRSLKRL